MLHLRLVSVSWVFWLLFQSLVLQGLWSSPSLSLTFFLLCVCQSLAFYFNIGGCCSAVSQVSSAGDAFIVWCICACKHFYFGLVVWKCVLSGSLQPEQLQLSIKHQLFWSFIHRFESFFKKKCEYFLAFDKTRHLRTSFWALGNSDQHFMAQRTNPSMDKMVDR